MSQLHLFDSQPVVAFQVRCSGMVDVTAAQADELAMHKKVVIVLVGTIDEAAHKTVKTGDVIRIGTLRVADGSFVTGEMCKTLMEMYNLDGGQQAFDLLGSPSATLANSFGDPNADIDDVDPMTGEIEPLTYVVPPSAASARADKALEAFLRGEA